MREMKDSGVEWIGKIPKEWKVQRIKILLKERNEKNSPVKTKLILSLGAKYGIIPYSEKDGGGNKSKEDVSAYKLAYKNDLVMNSMNIISGAVGMSDYFGCVSPVYYVYYPRKQTTNINYYHMVFQSQAFQRSLLGLGNGILIKETDSGSYNTVRMRIPIGKMNDVLLPVPSCIEQNEISQYLDSKCSKIDAIIEREQAVIEKLKEYKLSVITEAVTKGLNTAVEMKDSGVEFLGQVPSDWSVMKFGYCATIKSNLVPPEKYYDYPQISPDSIEKGSGKIINYKTVHEAGVISWNHLFYKGQIIYSKIRPMLNKVVIAPYDGLCSADMYPIETDNNCQFLMYMMLSDYFTAQVGLVTENRVKMPKINQNEINAIVVTIPSITEQEEIAKYLERKCIKIDDYISKKQAVIDKITEYKKSLIYEVVTGKLEV